MNSSGANSRRPNLSIGSAPALSVVALGTWRFRRCLVVSQGDNPGGGNGQPGSGIAVFPSIGQYCSAADYGYRVTLSQSYQGAGQVAKGSDQAKTPPAPLSRTGFTVCPDTDDL